MNINTSVFNDIDLTPEPQPVKTGKAGGWGQSYHWASLATVADDVADGQKHTEALEWCTETYGKPGSKWFEKERKFFFKSEKDMAHFLLRWA